MIPIHTMFDTTFRIDCFRQCEIINAVAQDCQSVVVIDRNGSKANAKSILSLMSLDYSGRVRIIASSPEEIHAIGHALAMSLKNRGWTF